MIEESKLLIRKAIRADVQEIVRIIADNTIGKLREAYQENIPEVYYDAFDRICDDKNQLLIVAIYKNKVVGTLQISFIQNMSVQGAYRALIESMHVDSNFRGQNIGSFMMNWAIETAKAKKCNIVQLTSNKERQKAHNFYRKFGFVATHEGFKMPLT
ncbi:GNAT family N-acetyltransferase [Rickettsiales bacterium]|nr:GNAT family N-acetyltransferase [Rickettsiales bacterium]